MPPSEKDQRSNDPRPGDLKCPDCGEPLVCSGHVATKQRRESPSREAYFRRALEEIANGPAGEQSHDWEEYALALKSHARRALADVASDCASKTSAEDSPLPAASYPGARPVPGDTQDHPGAFLPSAERHSSDPTSPGHQGSPDLVAPTSTRSSRVALASDPMADRIRDVMAKHLDCLRAEMLYDLVEVIREEREACARIVDRNDKSAWGMAREIRERSAQPVRKDEKR